MSVTTEYLRDASVVIGAAASLRDAAARFVGYRGVGRDITAQIELERELQRAGARAERAERPRPVSN